MAVQPSARVSVDSAGDPVIELAGARATSLRVAPPASAAAETAEASQSPALLALRLRAIDTFAEMIRLRTEVADRDRRIALLGAGVRTWRERAVAEQAARRREAVEAHEREREVISLLHQQMVMADAATAELERIRALPWWRRLRG